MCEKVVCRPSTVTPPPPARSPHHTPLHSPSPPPHLAPTHTTTPHHLPPLHTPQRVAEEREERRKGGEKPVVVNQDRREREERKKGCVLCTFLGCVGCVFSVWADPSVCLPWCVLWYSWTCVYGTFHWVWLWREATMPVYMCVATIYYSPNLMPALLSHSIVAVLQPWLWRHAEREREGGEAIGEVYYYYLCCAQPSLCGLYIPSSGFLLRTPETIPRKINKWNGNAMTKR